MCRMPFGQALQMGLVSGLPAGVGLGNLGGSIMRLRVAALIARGLTEKIVDEIGEPRRGTTSTATQRNSLFHHMDFRTKLLPLHSSPLPQSASAHGFTKIP